MCVSFIAHRLPVARSTHAYTVPCLPTPSFPRRSYSSSNRALKSIVASVDASSGGVAPDDGAHPMGNARPTDAVDPTFECVFDDERVARRAIRVDDERVR